MKLVMVVWTSRSEHGLLAPVITRLEEDPDIVVDPVHLHGVEWQLEDLYRDISDRIRVQKPDLVVASFDRVQMLFVAIAAMVQKVPVAQIHAGDLSGPGTWDDKVRWAISTIANLVFCNGLESYQRVFYWVDALEGQIQNVEHIHEVGSTMLDDIEPDKSILPEYGKVTMQGDEEASITFVMDISKEDAVHRSKELWRTFDLVLYNPETTGSDDLNLSHIFHLLNGSKNHVVWVGPNKDPGSTEIVKRVHNYGQQRGTFTYHDSVPRPQYLALLKHAARIIGNSSSFCLEAPTLRGNPPDDILRDITLIGDRNLASRARLIEMGASDKIVEHIRRYLNAL